MDSDIPLALLPVGKVARMRSVLRYLAAAAAVAAVVCALYPIVYIFGIAVI